MNAVTGSAPGKIVIAGEYAVLDGAPAIAMAVDRRAVARIATTRDGAHSVTALGFEAPTGRFRDAGGQLQWLEGGAAYGVIDAVWQALGLALSAPVAIELDTRRFVDPAQRAKLGLGSSAAITVALTAAVAAMVRPGGDFADTAYTAHRALQGGAGSGIDVAVALGGGLLEYRALDRSSRNLAWPEGLLMGVFWSGVAASTTARLARLATATPRASRRRLATAALFAAEAWGGGNPGDILGALAEYARVLREFSDDHDLDVFAAGHAELAAAAPKGVVYKPCGAGGGDLGMAFAEDPGAMGRFAGLADAHGFRRLTLSLELAGACQETQQP